MPGRHGARLTGSPEQLAGDAVRQDAQQEDGGGQQAGLADDRRREVRQELVDRAEERGAGQPCRPAMAVPPLMTVMNALAT